MPLNEEGIRAELTKLVARWSVKDGNERQEAQTFLIELFACYGQRLDDVATFEQFTAGGFVDLLWPRVCLFEMKSSSEASRLARHRPQALGYWRDVSDSDVPAPTYVVLCAFDRFEIWEPGRYPNDPRVEFELSDLPDRYTSLLFLAGDEPVFTARQEEVTLDLTVVFAFDDDYSIGVLTSSAHIAWAMSESSTLRVDLRYTPTSCFETFPWPEPTAKQRDEIGRTSAALIDRRQEICVERHIGLTELYNGVDEGAWDDLRKLHHDLDVAVLRAYGWPAAIADDPLELKNRLAARQREIAAGAPYDPFPA